MRPARTMRAAGLIVAAVVLGMLTVSGSYALWSTLVPSPAGTIRSADFLVTLTGANNAGTYNMVLPDGSPATVSLTSAAAPLKNLLPGVPVYAGVSVRNATAAGSAFTVKATVPGSPVITGSGGGTGLPTYLSVRSAPTTNLGQCSTLAESAYQDVFAGISIPKGGSAVVCFRIQLSAQAPSSLQGQSASIAVPLRVEQIQ